MPFPPPLANGREDSEAPKGSESNAMPPPALSVVIPCYRAAPIARASVERLREFLTAWLRDEWEIVVVDDGGHDLAEDEWQVDPRVHLVRLSQNIGKGGAIAAGMLTARGRHRIFTDVDLPYGIARFPAMVHYLESGHFHLVIGDRNLPDSSYHEVQGLLRRSVSRAAALLIGTMITGGFFDTQCGLKAIRGDVAEFIFPLMRIHGFTFDVELLYIALRNRLDVKRIPVRLERNETSSVHVLRDSARGVVDLSRIAYYRTVGDYDLAALRALTAVEFASVAGLESPALRTVHRRTPDSVSRDRERLVQPRPNQGDDAGGSVEPVRSAEPLSGASYPTSPSRSRAGDPRPESNRAR